MASPFLINHNCLLNLSSVPVSFETAWDAINGNSGNSLITHALARYIDLAPPFKGIANVFSRNANIADIRIPQNEFHSYAIFVMQDQINPSKQELDWDGLTEFVQAIDLPMIVVSLGVGGVKLRNPKSIAGAMTVAATRFFRVLSEKAVSIGVRGDITAAVLDEMGIRNFAVVGCPTYYGAGSTRVIERRELPKRPRVAGLGLFSTQDESVDLSFILQSERSLIELISAPDAVSFDQGELFPGYPGYGQAMVEAMLADRVRFFTNPAEWVMTLATDFDFAVGTRMHGAIMALNAGLPALVTAGDVRAEEMCAFFGIPFRPAHTTIDASIRELYDAVDVDAINQAYVGRQSCFLAWLDELKLLVRRDHNPADNWPWVHLPHRSKAAKKTILSQILGHKD